MRYMAQDMPDACETARRIALGEMTAETALRERLEIIDALEPDLKAWVSIDRDGAIKAARTSDTTSARGPLHGVPIGIKDIFAVRDMPWRCGSPIWKDRIAQHDAGSVALARSAGAIILGKNETTEFAGYKPTRTRNPRSLDKTSGGSSSGSAAAVGSGMVPIALGTQTSGSIIRPASYCGVVGFKPTFDLIETGGISPLSRSLDTVGVFARSVRDTALLVGALTGLDLNQTTTAEPDKLPIYRSPVWDEAEPDLVGAWLEFENRLGAKGVAHSFAPELETLLASAPALHARLMATEAAEALAYEHAEMPDALSPELRQQLESGQALSAERRSSDRRDFRKLRHLVEGLVPSDSVWLTPSATGPAPQFEAGTGSPAFNRIWSLLGLPCCSVPLLQTQAGLPMGVQVVGAVGNDVGVLAVADWLMLRFGTP